MPVILVETPATFEADSIEFMKSRIYASDDVLESRDRDSEINLSEEILNRPIRDEAVLDRPIRNEADPTPTVHVAGTASVTLLPTATATSKIYGMSDSTRINPVVLFKRLAYCFIHFQSK